MRSYLLLIIFCIFSQFARGQTDQFIIYFVSDTHGELDEKRILNEALYIEYLKEKCQELGIPLLLFHNGDFITGKKAKAQIHHSGFYDLQIYNALGDWTVNPGNHEFDDPEFLPKAVTAFGKDAFISSNFRDITGELQFQKFKIIKTKTEDIAILGLTDTNTPFSSGSSFSKSNRFSFAPALESMKQTLEELRNTKFNGKVILLSHIGYQEDLDLIEGLKKIYQNDETLPKIELILGGHTHVIKQNEFAMKEGYRLLHLHNGAYRDKLGHVIMNDRGEFRFENEFVNNLGDFTSRPGATMVKRILNRWSNDQSKELKELASYFHIENEFVALASHNFKLNLPLRLDHHAKFDPAHVEMGSILAESFLQFALTQYPNDQTNMINVGVMMHGGIRNPLIPNNDGVITLKELQKILPFQNQLSSFELNFEDAVKYLFELHQKNLTSPAYGNDLSISSQTFLKLADNISLNQLRNHYKKVWRELYKVKDFKDIKVRFTMPDYFAKGGDNYSNFESNKTFIIHKADEHHNDLYALTKYVQSLGQMPSQVVPIFLKSLALANKKYGLPNCYHFLTPAAGL
jgi:2',3'-cyclic-nucleotide 2'-phosphodiesterase (5'-nucleotidase family)